MFLTLLYQVFAALSSNSMELLNIPLPPKSKDKSFTPEASRASILDLPGHRTDIRALALSEDNTLLASCSNGAFLPLSSIS